MLFQIRFISALFIIFSFFFQTFSQERRDSVFHKNIFKLDFIPLYDVFFDSHFQIRMGMEYERFHSKKSSFACYLDAGLYEKYGFIKYYNFFNQNQGMYSVKQYVSIAGFHLLPSYNYYFYSSVKEPNGRFFSGVISDIGFYHKKISTYNSLNGESSSDKYNQVKAGAGLSLGFQNTFSRHFLYELKTSLLAKLYNYVSGEGQNPVKSLDAQWTSPNYNFWWIFNVKIGYAF